MRGQCYAGAVVSKFCYKKFISLKKHTEVSLSRKLTICLPLTSGCLLRVF